MKLQACVHALVYLAFACGVVYPQEKDEEIQSSSFLEGAWKRVFTEESTETHRALRYSGIVEGYFKTTTPTWWRLCIAGDKEWHKAAPKGLPDFPKWFSSSYQFSKSCTTFSLTDDGMLTAEAVQIEAVVRITCFEDGRESGTPKWTKTIDIHPGVSNGPSHHRCEIFALGNQFVVFGGHYPLFYVLVGDQRNGDVTIHITHSFLSGASR